MRAVMLLENFGRDVVAHIAACDAWLARHRALLAWMVELVRCMFGCRHQARLNFLCMFLAESYGAHAAGGAIFVQFFCLLALVV